MFSLLLSGVELVLESFLLVLETLLLFRADPGLHICHLGIVSLEFVLFVMHGGASLLLCIAVVTLDFDLDPLNLGLFKGHFSLIGSLELFVTAFRNSLLVG